jgi:hypothetical protein
VANVLAIEAKLLLRRGGQRRRFLFAILVIATPTFVTLGGCTSPEQEGRIEAERLAACLRAEQTGYPAMERLAATFLSGVGYSMYRVGTCEDTGMPGPTLYAEVPEWRQRDSAMQYFTRRGWMVVDGKLVSPSGKHGANIVISRDDDPGSAAYVIVQFFEIAH